jgi:hypothetical protein
MSLYQLTPEDVLPYVGDSPSAVGARAAKGAAARTKMRAERRCETLPAFRAAAQALLDTAYPTWFAEAFWIGDPSPAQLRPCAALGSAGAGGSGGGAAAATFQ